MTLFNPTPTKYTRALTASRRSDGDGIALVGGVTAVARRAALDLELALAATGCLSGGGQAEDGEDDGVGLHLWSMMLFRSGEMDG